MFINLSVVLAYLIKFGAYNYLDLFNFLAVYSRQLFLMTMIYLLIFSFSGLYRSRRGFLVEIDEIIGDFTGVLLGWIIIIVLTYIRGEYEYARSIILLSWPISLVFVTISRGIILKVELWNRAKGFGNKRAAIVGRGDLADSVARRINENPSYGIKLVGFIGGPKAGSLGDIDQMEKIINQNRIQALFIAERSYSREKLAELAAFCDQHNISLGTIPDVFQILTTSPSVEEIEGLPLISLKQTSFTPLNRFIKRAFDLALALFGLGLFAVPMVLIALVIKLVPPSGSIVYRQERVGRGGRVFNLYKFRTMIPDAEKYTGPVLAEKNDPRKTGLGKFLRATNLDELPQLFNILKGDMSFVGPRPERPMFVKEFKELIPKYMDRHKIRPGLAGWAQLHGGYHMLAEEKIKYDLYYLENWSFLLDIKIILKYIQIAFTFQRKN